MSDGNSRLVEALPRFCAIMVGACSFAVSYQTLRLEAIHVGAISDDWTSYLIPLIVDGGVIAASAVI
jgi:hypothetical protein